MMLYYEMEWLRLWGALHDCEISLAFIYEMDVLEPGKRRSYSGETSVAARG